MSTALVTGGRNYNDAAQVYETLDLAHASRPITLLVHGACTDYNKQLRGADKWAQQWAIIHEVPYLGVPARWSERGKRAGPLRNREMPQMCERFGVPVHRVIAFPGGTGTADMVSIAESLGIPVTRVGA